MAYTSDQRMKNILKDIHEEVLKELSQQKIFPNLELRIFDESSEDSRLFDDGGLTFRDPYVDLTLGSNDAGWILNGRPLVIIEGTFGTERGQFGDGQLNRFSHSAAVAMNGYVGVTLIPFKGESYSRTGTIPKGVKSNNLKIKQASIHKGFLTGALKISEKEKGLFLVVDAYDRISLMKLVVESVKDKLSLQNKFSDVVKKIFADMRTALGSYEYGKKSNQKIENLFDKSYRIISTHARIYTQNYAALTTSDKRDGHGMLGKNLIEIYNSEEDIVYSIFIRLSKTEVNNLKLKRSKEFKYIFGHPRVKVLCFDDLEFDDKDLRDQLYDLREINIFQNRKNELIRKIQKQFNEGKIRVLI